MSESKHNFDIFAFFGVNGGHGWMLRPLLPLLITTAAATTAATAATASAAATSTAAAASTSTTDRWTRGT